jgi:DNA polymerase-3 subunit chi
LLAYVDFSLTRIDFYTNVADKIATACRIAGKAHASGQRMLVFCPDRETAQRVDRMLWTAPATGFVPHCSPRDPLAAVTPIHIDERGDEPACDQVLLNLRSDWPPFFSRFERLIEIVALDEDDRAAARSRYKFYRDRGYEIRTHDLKENAQA